MFVEEYGVDVVMVSIISTTPYNARRKFQEDEEMFDACYRYLNEGQDALPKQSVVDFLDYLAFDQRYTNRTEPRDQEIVFVERGDIINRLNEDLFHVTQSSVGGFRAVACVDSTMAKTESDLIDTLASYSDHTPTTRAADWYTGQSGVDSFNGEA